MENVKVDHFQKITDTVIALLQKGIIPWRQPLSKYGLARNYITHKTYTGINVLLLNNTHHAAPLFLTFDEIKEKHGKVISGSKSHQAYYYKYVRHNSEGEEIDFETAKQLKEQSQEVKTRKYLRYFNVFNTEDVANIEFTYSVSNRAVNKVLETCEAVLTEMHDQPVIKNDDGTKLFYNPVKDFLNVPPVEVFPSQEDFYIELFQKLIHWTGGATRLNRAGITKSPKPNTKIHLQERLIGELGANYICGVLGITRPEISDPTYFDTWLRALQADKYILCNSASFAQQAADYVLMGWSSKNE